MEITLDNPRIFLTDYASYNNGSQFEFGHWVDLTDFADADELGEYISKHFKEADKESPLGGYDTREETMITDFENFPKELYSECMDFEALYNYLDALKDTNYNQEIIDAYISLYSLDQIKLLDERFFCDLSDSTNINQDFGYYLAENGFIEIPENVSDYFDYEKYGRHSLYYYYQENGYIFTP